MNIIKKHKPLAIACILSIYPLNAFAKSTAFTDGPVINKFGQHAAVPSNTVTSESQFNVAFDVGSTSSDPAIVNRKFNSLARFINMHVNAGVKQTNIHLALVVHGKATFDLLNDATYQKKYGTHNPNLPLIQSLIKNNVKIILCGQSAAAQNIDYSELMNGVELELSAMTAHAQLQQQGYTVNPF